MLSLLGSGMLLPLVSDRDEQNESYNPPQGEEFQTFLKPDGTLAKINPEAIKRVKVVRKNISNRKLLKWLKLRNSTSNIYDQ